MTDPERMDNGGDYYCALGWAYAWGKGREARELRKRSGRFFPPAPEPPSTAEKVFDEIGLFDEAHFAYLEDIDHSSYRARIAGYRNYYIPEAVVRHAGSATTGSVYNEFKIRYSSRNSIYLVYKNMPWPQILLNLPLLAAGFLIKTLFFAAKGYSQGICHRAWGKARRCARRERKVPFRRKNLKNYVPHPVGTLGQHVPPPDRSACLTEARAEGEDTLIKDNQRYFIRLQVVLDGAVLIFSYVVAWYFYLVASGRDGGDRRAAGADLYDGPCVSCTLFSSALLCLQSVRHRADYGDGAWRAATSSRRTSSAAFPSWPCST